MQKVLIIDDEEDVAKVVSQEIESGIPGVKCVMEMDFAKAISSIAELRPDAIVLDLMEGSQSTNLLGESAWASVWDKSFCPIVIYTGWEGDLQPPVPSNHPFVKRVSKGSGSQKRVLDELKNFRPAVDAVRGLHHEINAVIHRVLRDTAGAGLMSISEKDHLLHAGRRRIAAEMDNATVTEQKKLKSWEQYLVPAIGDSPLTADILRQRGAASDKPESYRLVLTPSCDMVKGRCEPTLIVARCEDTSRLAKKLSLSLAVNKLDKDATAVVSKALTAGVFAGFLPLPSFPEVLPVMVANLKDLEVIRYEAIGRNTGTEPNFERIASIDSPFREQVSWSYMATAGRPGMPDRELDPWAQEIVRVAAARNPSTSQTTPS